MATNDSKDDRPNRPNFLILCMDQWQTHMELPDDVSFPFLKCTEYDSHSSLSEIR
jgi:hypothetical protein